MQLNSIIEPLVYGPMYEKDMLLDVRAAYFDIDNTLVENDSPDIPSIEFCNLAKNIGKVLPIAVATARSLQRAIHILEAIDSRGISILSNGAVLYDGKQKKIIVDLSLPVAIAGSIVSQLQLHNMSYEIQDDGIDYSWTMPNSKLKSVSTYKTYCTSRNILLTIPYTYAQAQY